MPRKIYFQWQNDILRRSIYPLREMKLRDFLVFTYEIDIWKQYKDLSASDLEAESQAFQIFFARQSKEHYTDYLHLRTYFTCPAAFPLQPPQDPCSDLIAANLAAFPTPDPGAAALVNQIHQEFSVHFLRYQRVDRERYFIDDRLARLENAVRSHQKEIETIRRQLTNMGETWTRRPEKLARLEQIEQAALPLLGQEYERLRDFSTAMARIQERRVKLLAWRKEHQAARAALSVELERLSAAHQAQVRQQQASPTPAREERIAELSAQVEHLRSALQGADARLELDEYAQVEQASPLPPVGKVDIVRGRVEALRAELERKDHAALLEQVVKFFVENPTRCPLWLQYMVIHFSGMRYQSAHGSWADPRDLLLALAEKDIESQLNRLPDLAVEALCREKLSLYESVLNPHAAADAAPLDPTGLPRLLRTRTAQWRTAAGDHLRRLRQYNLRLRLTTPDRTPVPVFDLRSGEMKDSGRAIRSGAEVVTEPLPLTLDQSYYRITLFPENQQLAGRYVAAGAASVVPNPYKRKALVDLLAAEAACRIEEELSDAAVLAELEQMRARLELPAWMWNEIVRLTDLRLHTRDLSWENQSFTPEEIEQRNSFRFRGYSALLNNWKQANLTGWRAEHDRSNRLIVTRAVCNEVGEHILHLRGRTPPGGLTAKPIWYRRQEKAAQAAPTAGSAADDRPYFVRAVQPDNFRPGAGLFWLRFVPQEPNAWRVAPPLQLSDGSGLLPASLPVSQRENTSGGERWDPSKVPVLKSAGRWSYYQVPDGRYKRVRTVEDPSGRTYQDDNWLRWMHEAAVIELAETASGPTVLTFETALPGEDRRRSTIGVFKHSLDSLKYAVSEHAFNGTFLGYIPDGPLPLGDLMQMLDWNRILLRPGFLSPAEMQAFWQAAAGAVFDPTLEESQPERVEAAPPLKSSAAAQAEALTCFEADLEARTVVPHLPASPALSTDLPRGVRLCVDRGRPFTLGATVFLPVLSCEAVPLAQDLYVEASGVLPAPEDRPDLPVHLLQPASLFRLSHLGADGRPVFMPLVSAGTANGQSLPTGTRLLLSAAHTLTPHDPSPGSLLGPGGQIYHLVLECPVHPGACGHFIRAAAAAPTSPQDYLLNALDPSAPPDGRLKVRLLPTGTPPRVQVYRRSGETFLPHQLATPPTSAGVWVASPPEFTPGEEHYRILEYPGRPDLTGFYLKASRVSI